MVIARLVGYISFGGIPPYPSYISLCISLMGYNRTLSAQESMARLLHVMGWHGSCIALQCCHSLGYAYQLKTLVNQSLVKQFDLGLDVYLPVCHDCYQVRGACRRVISITVQAAILKLPYLWRLKLVKPVTYMVCMVIVEKQSIPWAESLKHQNGEICLALRTCAI